jgi:hypothetical protein
MDGKNSLQDIINIMESEFKEEIIPSKQRITTSIMKFIELRLVIVLTNADEIVWNTESFKK